MKDFLLTRLHLAVTTAKLCGPGGVRAVMAENLLLKQQLMVLRRAHRRAPNLTQSDRLLCGFLSLLLRPERIRKVAVACRPLIHLSSAYGKWREEIAVRHSGLRVSNAPLPVLIRDSPMKRKASLTELVSEDVRTEAHGRLGPAPGNVRRFW